jgi:diguanylate cyclase (GGDEF)-like protein/putative nucleotidyltransferase with HDIG domain
MSSTATAIENYPENAAAGASGPWSSSISLSVRARIIIGFGALVFILVAVTTAAAIQEQNHKSELAQLDLHSREATSLQTTEAQAAIAADDLQRYVYEGNTTYIPDINAAASTAQASLVAALALGAPDGGDQMAAVGAQLVQGAAQTLALREAGDTADATATLDSLVPIFHDQQLRLEKMTSAELTQVTQLRASADRAGNLAFWLLVASGALGVVMGLAVSFWVARSIARPLAQLEVTARRVSEGDLSARAPNRGPRELSHLGSVLNEMMSAIEKRTEDLSQANHHLTDARTQAAKDPLTGLGNHRSFHKRLQDEAAAAAGGVSLGLVMMDLDGFKEVNDSLGHLAGDQLLREVASAMIGVVGDENAYRYGGDEFAVLLPDCDQLTTMTTAESLRHAFLAIDHPTAGRVAASFGVASMPESASTPEELVYRADMAMYLAKSSGKDRVADWGDLISASANTSPVDSPGSRLRQPGIITSLCVALEAKDPSTRAHAERCARYSTELGAELGLVQQEIADLKLAALLHDIGKMVLPDHILQKPGPLSQEEMDLIRHHPLHGASMLSQVSVASGAVPSIHHHHEHFDGSGYPDGLAGDAIPIGARVLAVTDAFDAMTSDRPYGAAVSVEDAVAELIRCGGSQFDEVVVEAFVRVLESEPGTSTHHRLQLGLASPGAHSCPPIQMLGSRRSFTSSGRQGPGL